MLLRIADKRNDTSVLLHRVFNGTILICLVFVSLLPDKIWITKVAAPEPISISEPLKKRYLGIYLFEL